MSFPVEIREPKRSTDNPQEWTLLFNGSDLLPPPVEREAMKMVDCLLRTYLLQRYGAIALCDVTRVQAQIVVDEMQAAGVQNIHEAVVWTYHQLLPNLGQG